MKHFIYFITSLVILNLSCTKSGKDLSVNSQTKVDEILAMNNGSAQRTAYRLLNADEKSALWKVYLTANLKNYDQNSAKAALIKKVISLIRPAFFESQTEKNLETEKIKIIYQVHNVFPQKEFYQTFNSLGKDNINVNPNQTAPPPDCYCNASGFNSCPLSGSACLTLNPCKPTDDGCGWLWQSSCSGNCYDFPPGN